MSNIFAYGLPVGSEFRVNTTTPNIQDQPQLTALTGGGFVVVWRDASGALGPNTGSEIRGQRFDANGQAVGTEFVVNQITTTNTTFPAVAATANGGFTVSWSDSVSGTRLRSFDGNAQPTTAEIGVQSLVQLTTFQTSVAVLPTGQSMVVWDVQPSADSTARDVKGRIYAADGVTPVTGEFLVSSAADLGQGAVRVTALNGQFLTTWADGRPVNGVDQGLDILAQRFDATGVRLGTEIRVNTTVAGGQSTPAAAAVPGGGFIIAWADVAATQGGEGNVRAQRFDANGAKLGAEILVSTPGQGQQTQPTVVVLADGTFGIAWVDATGTAADGSDRGIFAQQFAADGSRLGEPFAVSAPSVGTKAGVTAAVLASGRIVASWADLANESADPVAGGGIKAQLVQPLTRVLGTAGNDTLNGTAANEAIEGLGGNDVLTGGAGIDLIDGGAGDDQINGGADTDVLFGDAGNDTLDGGAGDDEIYGGDGNDTLTDTQGDNGYLEAGLGDDVVTVNAPVAVAGGGTWAIDGAEGNDRLTLTGAVRNGFVLGGSGDDTLVANVTGTVAGNTLQVIGDEGRDDITVSVAGGGTALVAGGTGADTIRLGGGTVTVLGVAADGPDTILPTAGVRITADIQPFTAGEEGVRLDLSVYGADAFATGALTAVQVGGDVRISHGATGSVFTLRATSVGELSTYNLGIATGRFAPQGRTINDAFATDPNFDNAGFLAGGDGNDVIRGFGGSDTIRGAGGNDYLDGGRGNDLLTGGSGADVFAFETAQAGNDFVTDFSAAAGDRFNLGGGSFTAVSEGAGGTTLTHGGGTIQVSGVTGLTLAQWNALVVTGGIPSTNTAPVITSAATATVAENVAAGLAGVVVLDVNATDAQNDLYSFSLTGPDAALFAINFQTGQIRFVNSPDFEATPAKTVYNITAVVTDNGTPPLSISQAITITLTNVNEAPVFAQTALVVTTPENIPAAQVVYTAAASDPDANAVLTYTLGGPDAAAFTLNAQTGALNFRVSPDYEAKAGYSVTITATDQGGLSSTQSLLLGVLDLVEAAPLPAPVVVASPVNGGTGVNVSANPSLLFSGAVTRGTGAITLSANGQVVESFDAATSSRVSVSGNRLVIDPTRALDPNTTYTVSIAAGALSVGGVAYPGTGNFVFSTAPALSATASSYQLAAVADTSVTVAGSGQVIGDSGRQNVTVLDTPGRVVLDGSFNLGGDRVTLAGNAANWTARRNGTAVELSDGDTIVLAPVGTGGANIAFADGVRILSLDQAAGAVRIGDQSVGTTAAVVTAAAQTATVQPGGAATAQLALTPAAAVVAAGKELVFGTAGTETVYVQGGSELVLDGSFNLGGDTIKLPGGAAAYTAVRSGSAVVLTSTAVIDYASSAGLTQQPARSVTIPIGPATTTIAFDDVAQALRFDTATGAVLIGSTTVTTTATQLSGPPALPPIPLDADTDGNLGTVRVFDANLPQPTRFIDDASVAQNVRITGFGAGDQLLINGNAADHFISASNGDLVISRVLADGTLSTTTIVGLVNPAFFVNSELSAEIAAGYANFLSFTG